MMERVKCKHCETEYEVTLFRVETKEPKHEDCEACGKLLWSWNCSVLPMFTRIEEGRI